MSDKCNVLQFDAVPESLDAKNMGANDLWGIPEPAKLRDIVVLSYFGHLYRGPASTTFLQVWPLPHFFLLAFCKNHLVREETNLFRSSQQLPHLGLGTLKRFLC